MHIQTSDQPALDLGFGGYTCNWGIHVCGLYDSPAERDNIIMGFVHQGIVDGHLQLYCHSERSAADFAQTYRAIYPEHAQHLADPDCCRVLPARDLYYPNGKFSPWDMDDGLSAFYAESQRNGYRPVRATAEMVWALEAIPGVEHLMAYEARLNYFIPGKPWISICLYNLRRFSGDMVMNVLRTHPFSISGGVIMTNPYYQDPGRWLTEHAPQFLTRPAAY